MADGGPSRRRHQRISEVLRALAAGLDEPTVSIGRIADRLGARAFGLLILVAALPMVIPNLPGVSTVFGILIIVPALQLAMGRRRIRLPHRLRRATVARKTIRLVITKTAPYVEKAERLMRPRLRRLTHGTALNVAGALMVMLGVVMALPIPFGNSPPAVSCALIAIGVLARDGLFVVLGAAVGIVAFAFAATVVYGFFFVASAVAG
jgi:hypothetical protein